MIEIVYYSNRYEDAFEQLNREWLERYFRVEPIDAEVLKDPVGQVLDEGGQIFYAVAGGEAIGTVALKHHGEGCFELTKMAVTDGQQGAGVGRQLMVKAIDEFERIGGKRLFLESHSSLKAALTLYESAGFRHVPRNTPSDYERADVYMVYQPVAAAD